MEFVLSEFIVPAIDTEAKVMIRLTDDVIEGQYTGKVLSKMIVEGEFLLKESFF